MEWITHLEYWHWWTLGIALVIVEMLAPGVYFLWLGIAAILVGFVLWLLPDTGWQAQFVLFAIFSVITVIGYRTWLKRHPITSDTPALNRRSEQYIGRVFTLTEPIINRNGKISVDDSRWKIEGDDMPAGSQVRVCDVDGAVLKVEAVD